MRGYIFPSTSPYGTLETRWRRSRRRSIHRMHEWSRAATIVCDVIENKTGSGKLTGRALPCAVANAAPMSVAEVTADLAGVAPLSVQ